MKKEIVLTVRIEEQTYLAIKRMAEKDERTVAFVARKLIQEGLKRSHSRKTGK